MRGIRSVLCLVLLLTGGTVAAQSFSIDSGVGFEGDQFTLTISYNAGGNADSLEGELLYDSTNLTADVDGPGAPAMPLCGGLANAVAPDIIMSCTDDGAGTITFIGFSPTNSTGVSGSFGAIQFTVANPINPAPPQVFPLDITNEVFFDDGNPVAAGTSTDGTISVGAGAGAGVMEVAPPTLPLVNTVNGPVSSQNLTISNTGGMPLTADCSLGGVTADPGILLSVPPFMGMLGAGASTVVAASCSGTASGNASGTYTCDGGAAGMDSSMVSCMVGAGVAVPNPAAGSMLTLPVGPVVRGGNGNGTQSFSEDNNQGAGYDVTCNITDTGGGAFALSSPMMQSVPPGGSVGFTVSGQSSLLDPQPTGTMVCTYSNGAMGTVTVSLIISLIPEIVPTLSQWGLILMVLGLIGFGAHRLRQRAHVA